MSGLLYYFRGIVGKPTQEDLSSCGLSGCNPKTVRGVEAFSDHSHGSIFTIEGKTDDKFDIGFYPSKQEWLDIPNTKLSIGFDKENKPTPYDFLKEEYLGGHKVKLGDGNEWEIPLARKFQAGCVLPKRMFMIEAGKMQKVVVSKYLELQKIGEKLEGLIPQALRKNKEDYDLSFIDNDEKIFNLCVEILRFNYNLDFREICILGLLETSNMVETLRAVVDVPQIIKLVAEELEKKKD